MDHLSMLFRCFLNLFFLFFFSFRKVLSNSRVSLFITAIMLFHWDEKKKTELLVADLSIRNIYLHTEFKNEEILKTIFDAHQRIWEVFTILNFKHHPCFCPHGTCRRLDSTLNINLIWRNKIDRNWSRRRIRKNAPVYNNSL